MVALKSPKTRFFAGLDLLDDVEFDTEVDTCKAAELLQTDGHHRPKSFTQNVLTYRSSKPSSPSSSFLAMKESIRKRKASRSFESPKSPHVSQRHQGKGSPGHVTISESPVHKSSTSKRRRKKDTEQMEKPLSINIPRSRTKSEKQIPMQPVSQQWFRGQRFFYLPNNDISSLKRTRIRRAISYGAIWETTWSVLIDFLIVEDDYDYQMALDELKLPSFHDSLNVVNNSYAVDCIQWKTKHDPRFYAYQVKGDPRMLAEQERNKPLPAQNETPYITPSSIEEALDPDQEPEIAAVPKAAEPEFDFDAIVTEAQQLRDEQSDLSTDDEMELTKSDLPGGPTETADQSAGQATSSTKRFACMQPVKAGEGGLNPNARTIEILQELCDHYGMTHDQWRHMAYRRVISALKKELKFIGTAAEAASVLGVKGRIAEKIEEIVTTNHLRRLDYIRDDPADQALALFTRVYGAGPFRAASWVAQGYRNLSDIPYESLTPVQKIGVDHFASFDERITREEVTEHATIVRTLLSKIDPAIQTHVMGSYRRGAATCGDIDIIITKPSAPLLTLRAICISQLLPALTKAGFITATLASLSLRRGAIWHGASRLPGTTAWRRLDLLLVPDAELGAAMLYFTGDAIFNRSMRLLARKKGMTLSQHGLYKNVLRQGQQKVTKGQLLEAKDEKRIFELLGVPWRAAKDRNM